MSLLRRGGQQRDPALSTQLTVAQPQQQQALQQQLQSQHVPAPSSFTKVVSWLNNSSCSGSCTHSGPLLSRASSLLWCLGLGSMLRPKRASPSSSSRQAASATAAARPGSQPACATAAGQPSGKALCGRAPLPSAAKAFPASHPLTAQQLQQSAGFGSSAASETAAGAAALQGPSTGVKARSALALGPAGAAAVKAGDDIIALIGSLPRTLRTLQWAVQAAVGYKRLLVRLDPSLDSDSYGRQLSQLHDYWAQRLTEVCRANGGVYVKAGQFAAAFGAVPNEYRKHLALLQDKAKPRPFHVVDRVIRLELGAGAEEVFAEFSAEATAAASLAQVHKARLQNGQQVAVKVQYPGLRGAANADLTTLSCLSRCAQALFPEFRLAWLYDELRLKLTEELDFLIEVRHGQHLMACLAPEAAAAAAAESAAKRGDIGSRSISSRCGVTVPAAHESLCTSKVITMEWIDGLKVNDTQALRSARISPHAVGRAVDEAFAEMTFLHAYIHSDPHPGNIMVRAKGRRGLLSWLMRGSWQPFEVVLLDHGSYLSISDRLRQKYCQLWCALFAGDAAGAASVAIELGGQRAGQILPIILTQRGRNKQEQREMQRAAGVASFGDITQLLATAPRDVVELLRIAAVVRNVTASLGCSLADRLRINGTWAFRGLPPLCGGSSGDDAGGGSEADKRFNSRGYRLNIQSRLLLIRGFLAVNTAMHRVLLASLAVFGQPVLLY